VILRRTRVNTRYLTAAALALVITVAGCSSKKSTTPAASASTAPSASSAGSASSAAGGSSGTFTVWLQQDAKTGWPQLVADTTTAFNKTYPNVKVDVQYQNWTDHLTKFDTQLAANTAPDVIEMGNTEMAKYMIDGAMTDITADKGKFEDSANWLPGLANSAVLDGKVYGVPYYAGARGISYRSDLWSAAGASTTLASVDDLITACKAVQAKATDKNFSAFYIPGKYWYMAMAFVYGSASPSSKA
jgi:N,N'-diacetylchitobiose transport system substrate-binding protein